MRRTVGALVGVAQGLMNLGHIQHMLDEPSYDNFIYGCVAPPDGLYLLGVEYPPYAFLEAEEGEEREELCEGKVEKGEEGERKGEEVER